MITGGLKDEEKSQDSPLIISVKGSSSMFHKIQREGNKYTWTFDDGSKLFSPSVGMWLSQGAHLEHSVGDWYIILADGMEIPLPKDRGWRILFEDGAKIVSLPYKTLIFGQWILVDWENNKGMALVYLGSCRYGNDYHDSYKTHSKYDISKKATRERTKAHKKRSHRDDNEDDEDNIMRALGGGNGDIFGF